MNPTDACRICLLSDVNSDMQLLFKDFPEESVIIQKIELCGGIKVEIRDDLPRKICGQCLFSLNSSYDFRKLCQTNDLKLRNICIPEKIEIKDEPQSEDRASLLVTPDTVFLSELSNDSSLFDPAEEDIKNEFQEPINRKSTKRSYGNPPKKLGKKPKPKEIQICELCGNVYTRPGLLMLHMRRHAADKPYCCEICKRRFTCQSEINRHMRVHTGVRPFKCKYCDRKFSDRSTNIKHERTHTGQRPFECATCGKAFTYSNVLKNHMLTHTGEKRFRCDVCNKTFSRAHQLKQHFTTMVHQQKEAKLNLANREENTDTNGNANTK